MSENIVSLHVGKVEKLIMNPGFDQDPDLSPKTNNIYIYFYK